MGPGARLQAPARPALILFVYAGLLGQRGTVIQVGVFEAARAR